MTSLTLLTLIGICILGAMTPGASLAVVVHQTLRYGRAFGLATAVAHGVAVGLYAFLAVAGLGLIYQQSPVMRGVVAGLGGAYLLNMAWRLWRGTKTTVESGQNAVPVAETRQGSLAAAVRAGFLIAILNPKIAIFFLALFSQLATPEMDWISYLLMALIAGAIDLGWYVIVALGLSRSGVLQRIEKHQNLLDRITALVLASVAVVVLAGLFV